MKTHRILELDGLRAFAVVFVVLYHGIEYGGLFTSLHPVIKSIISILGTGGVNIFFAISGFIITTLLLREADTTGTVSLFSFYRRRFLRIFPPLAFYLITVFVLFKLDYIQGKLINFLAGFLFLGNLGLFSKINSGNWFIAHTWSLSVEEQYYLILPPIMVLVFKLKKQPINILLILLFFICLFANTLAKAASTFIYPSLTSLYALYPFRYIITGVTLALHKDYVLRTLKNTSILIPCTLLLFILIMPFIRHIPVISILLSGAETISNGILILWFIANPDRCTILRHRLVQWIGACSYSIYLWQQLFTAPHNFYNGWPLSQFPFFIIFIFILSAISHYFIELPSIRLSKHYTAKANILNKTPAPL